MTKNKRLLAGLCVTLAFSLKAGDLTVDNLTVKEDAVFHGNITISDLINTNLAPSNGIVVCWHFDETNGTAAADASSNANHGTLINGPIWMSGKINNALGFDGADDYLSVSGLQGIATGDVPHTLSVWIKINSLPETTPAWMVVLGSPAAGAHTWLLDATGALTMGAWGGNSIGAVILTNTWQHLTATYDGSALIGYLDGVQVSSNNAAFNLQGLPLSVAHKPAGETGVCFAGVLDELRLYDRALTSNEVAALFNSAAPSYYAGKLVVPGMTISNEIHQTVIGVTNIFMGQVGVGTDAPAEQFHVVGNLRVDGTSIVQGITLGGKTMTSWPDSGDFKSDGTIPMSGTLNLSGQSISNVGNITNWTKSSAGVSFLRRDGSLPMAGDLNLNGNKIDNCGAITLGEKELTNWPSMDVDYGTGSTESYRGDWGAAVSNTANYAHILAESALPTTGGTMSGNINMGAQSITNVNDVYSHNIVMTGGNIDGGGGDVTNVGAVTGSGIVAGRQPGWYLTHGATVIPSGESKEIAYTNVIETNMVNIDTGNFRLTPEVAGYYSVSASLRMNNMPLTVTNKQIYVAIAKNDTSLCWGNQTFSIKSTMRLDFNLSAARVYMNGSTDYFTVRFYHNYGFTITNSNNSGHFMGTLISK